MPTTKSATSPYNLTLTTASITGGSSEISVNFDINKTLTDLSTGNLRCATSVDNSTSPSTVTLKFWVTNNDPGMATPITYDYSGRINPHVNSSTATVIVAIMSENEDPSGEPIEQVSMETGQITPL